MDDNLSPSNHRNCRRLLCKVSLPQRHSADCVLSFLRQLFFSLSLSLSLSWRNLNFLLLKACFRRTMVELYNGRGVHKISCFQVLFSSWFCSTSSATHLPVKSVTILKQLVWTSMKLMALNKPCTTDHFYYIWACQYCFCGKRCVLHPKIKQRIKLVSSG